MAEDIFIPLHIRVNGDNPTQCSNECPFIDFDEHWRKCRVYNVRLETTDLQYQTDYHRTTKCIDDMGTGG